MSAIFLDDKYTSRSCQPSNKAKTKAIAGFVNTRNREIEYNVQDGIIQTISITETEEALDAINKETLNVGWYGTVTIRIDENGDLKIQKKRNLK